MTLRIKRKSKILLISIMWVGKVLNTTTTFLAIYLLYNEFSNFLIVKPTQTSLEQSYQKREYFPVVLACPVPAFNLTALKEEAYEDAFRLWTGNEPFTLDRNS